MFRRGMTSLALAGVMALAIGVPAVLADTTGNFDEYDASFSLGDGSVQVTASIGKSDLGPINTLSVSTFSVEEITCSDGSDGTIERSFNGETSSATIKIDKNLKAAHVSGTAAGTEDTYNSCTDHGSGVDATRDVSMDLHATGGSSKSNSRTVTTYPDGSKETSTFKIDSRFAGGTVELGGTTYTADPGEASIDHVVSTDVIKPPPHH